jgi:prepilin-type N-terminal cleavage/methylation domain-containing protein
MVASPPVLEATGRTGFTLVELSIVLVIIGLIIGGVLVGRELIAASQLRAQISQFEKYNQAVNTFRGKYNCLPGDCANATDFFSNLKAPYDNGDGDGKLIDTNNQTGFPVTVDFEPTTFWAHLFSAGLTDCCDPANISYYVLGKDIPKDKMNGYGIATANLGGKNGYFWGITNSCSPSTPCVQNANTFLALSNSVTGVITPAQAQAFDTKIDDGNATTGNVYAAWVWGGDTHLHPQWTHSGYNCLTSATPNAYNVSYLGTACTLWINMQGM